MVINLVGCIQPEKLISFVALAEKAYFYYSDFQWKSWRYKTAESALETYLYH